MQRFHINTLVELSYLQRPSIFNYVFNIELLVPIYGYSKLLGQHYMTLGKGYVPLPNKAHGKYPVLCKNDGICLLD